MAFGDVKLSRGLLCHQPNSLLDIFDEEGRIQCLKALEGHVQSQREGGMDALHLGLRISRWLCVEELPIKGHALYPYRKFVDHAEHCQLLLSAVRVVRRRTKLLLQVRLVSLFELGESVGLVESKDFCEGGTLVLRIPSGSQNFL